MPPRLLLVNGPNLNQLGSREPDIYGRETLADIEKQCGAAAKKLGLALDCFQSNHEGELVDAIQKAGGNCAGIILNAGAYTHTSIAIMDALLAVSIPVIEVHMSNIFRREEFRHESYVSKAAKGVICGFGSRSYLLAIEAMADLARSK
ncbi:MAG: type II 3-dehydroquinate dehydratase [Pseudomonadota bacterium]|nr:type II 3-dehydroquinate dehydratase [Pseudomonadota bacterium]MDE3037703.1 type II 3-dehydroquinate dehydratase [Pseudomonadota bacterium]